MITLAFTLKFFSQSTENCNFKFYSVLIGLLKMLLIFSDSSRLITFFRKFDVCELETVFDFKTLDSPIKEEATRGIIQKCS